jgi:hypothetical protein
MQTDFDITTSTGDPRFFEVLTDPSIDLDTYTVRLVKVPKPIVLTDLGSLTIEGVGTSQIPCCELDEELHWEILLKAVELATAVYKLGTPASDTEPQQAKEKANSQR